jgi:cytochrome b6
VTVTEPAKESWFSDRVGSVAFKQRLGARKISTTNPILYIGMAIAFLFLLQVLSGILLLLPYRPDPASAHESMVSIVGRVPYGSLVRGVHVWSSQLFVFGVMLQLTVILLTRRFKPPRELVWLSGLGLLLLAVGMAFTGVILPWNQNAYMQARVSSQIVGEAPLFGPWLERMLRGGPEVGTWSLHHAYGFHTGALPALTTLVLAMHVVLVQRKPAQGTRDESTVPLYPDFLVRVGAVLTGVLILVVSLATFTSVPLGTAVDFTAPMPARVLPPWYFLFMHQLFRSAPPHLLGVDSAKFIMGALSFLGVGAIALPFLDRRGSRITFYLGLVLVALWALLTVYAVL